MVSINKNVFVVSTRIISHLLQKLLAAFIVLILFTELPLWTDSFLGTVNTPIIYAGFMATVALFALSKPKSIFLYAKSPFALWCLAILVIYALNLLRLQQQSFPLDDIDTQINVLQYFLLAPTIGYLVFRTDGEYFKPFLVALSVLVPLLIIFDFFNPGLFYPNENFEAGSQDATRVSGTWFNANAASEAAVLSLILVRNLVSRIFLTLVYTLVAFALILTGSRSGMIALIGIGIFLLFQRRLPFIYLVLPILVFIFIGPLLATFEDLASSAGRDAGINDVLARLEFVTGQTSGELDDTSSESRLDVLVVSFRESLTKVFVGHGVDFYDTVWKVGTHNLSMSMFYTYGIFGFLVWLSLILVVWKSSKNSRLVQPMLLVWFWFSMFSHSILFKNYWFVFLALSLKEISVPHIEEIILPHRKRKRRKKGRKKRRRTSSKVAT